MDNDLIRAAAEIGIDTTKDPRIAALAVLDRASTDPQCASFVRAIYREDAERLRHELSLDGFDVPDAPDHDVCPVAHGGEG